MRAAPGRFGLALAGLVVLAALLRVPALGRDGLWADEATTVAYARAPPGDMARQLAADVQAPLYYLAQHAILRALGDSELVLRLLSCAASLATVALAGLAGRRALSPGAGLVAALLLAVAPGSVHYAREARAYALLGLLVVAGWMALERLRERPSLSRAALAGGLLGLLPLTHGLGLFYAGGLLLASWPSRAIREATSRARLVAAGAAVLALFAIVQLPWTLVAAGQGGHAREAYSWARPAWDHAFPAQVPLSVAVMSPAGPMPWHNMVFHVPALALAGGVAAALLAAAGVLAARRFADVRAPARLVVAVLAPLVTLFVAAWAIAPVYVVGRVDMPLQPLLMMAIAAGLVALPRRGAQAGAILLVAAAIPGLLEIARDTSRSMEREIVTGVAARIGPRDPIVVTSAFRHAFDHYLPRSGHSGAVRGFPAQREIHPSWYDPALDDAAALEAQAERLADEIVAALRADGGRAAWVFLARAPENEPIARALGRRLVAAPPVQTPYPNYLLLGFGPAVSP